MPSSPSGCRQTWSAPASRCARTTSAICSALPWGMTASISRSEPPSARSALGEAELEQVLRVVAQAEVQLRVVAGDGLGAHRVGVDDARHLGRHELAGTEPLAGEARVLDGHEVRVGARRALAGEVEHLRAERGQAALVDRRRGRRRVEAVEERAHRRQRPAVVARRLGVADADAEHERARGTPRAGRRRRRPSRRGRCSRR